MLLNGMILIWLMKVGRGEKKIGLLMHHLQVHSYAVSSLYFISPQQLGISCEVDFSPITVYHRAPKLLESQCQIPTRMTYC